MEGQVLVLSLPTQRSLFDLRLCMGNTSNSEEASNTSTSRDASSGSSNNNNNDDSAGTWTTSLSHPCVQQVCVNTWASVGVQVGDFLLSVGPHSLCNVSPEKAVEFLANANAGPLVVLRQNNKQKSSTKPINTPKSGSELSPKPPPADSNETQVLPQKRPAVKMETNHLVTPNGSTTPVVGKSAMLPIELLDDDDDDDDNDCAAIDLPGKKQRIERQSPSCTIDLLQDESDHSEEANLPTITLRAPGNAIFPHTIDTGFAGNAVYQKLPDKGKGLLSRILLRSPRTASENPLMWPQTTPIPSVGGGFYETICGKSRKTHSRVARLAGCVTVSVCIRDARAARICLAAKKASNDFILAESLLQFPGTDGIFISRKSREILEAIQYLNDMDNPFGNRCLYVLAEKPLYRQPLPGMTLVAEFKFHCYFRRTLFGLSTNPHTATLLNALEPLDDNMSASWKPCRKVLPTTNVFQHSPPPGKNGDHSLPAILWSNESTGYPVPTTSEKKYKGVKVTLRDYQVESVAWMKRQECRESTEGGGVRGLNGFFWERRTFADGESYYYFPLGGQVLLTPPPIVTGGMLTQEMGLGKTISALEMICSDVKEIPSGFGGTLVVVPVSLLVQWENEIKTKTPHLTMFLYHGEGLEAFQKEFRGQIEEELSKFDIVLTTMSKLKELTASRGNGRTFRSFCLQKVKWHRLVVDECQFLKNDTTAIARATSVITATHVWMLSGTPLTNKLDDLRGELSLLRIWPFTLGTGNDNEWLDHFWEEYIKRRWDNGDPQSIAIINNLMQAVSLRHSRLQTRIDGSPLVELPPKSETFIAITADSNSSSVAVSRWVEDLASRLLRRRKRFDLNVFSLVGKLRLLASSPGALLDGTSLEHLDSVLSELSSHKAIRKVSLHDAIAELRGKRDSPNLQELLNLATHGPGTLAPCIFCRKERLQPALMPCNHSLCFGCCDMLLAASDSFACPVCSEQVHMNGITQVVLPTNLARTSTSTSAATRPIEIDWDESQINQAVVNQEAYPPSPQKESSQVADATSYEFEQIEDFDSKSLSNNSSKSVHPNAPLSDNTLQQAGDIVAGLRNASKLKTVVGHAVVCEAETFASPKIKALCDTIQQIRNESLEAKICIFSSYAIALDEVEHALDNVRYKVEYDMNTKNKLLSGQTVILPNGGMGHVLEEDKGRCSSSSDEDAESEVIFYKVKTSDGETVTERRDDLRVKPVVVEDVPSRRLRKSSKEKSLSVNGSDCRHVLGALVESKRPVVASTELQVGYTVTILPDDNKGKAADGKVLFVHNHHDILGKGTSGVSFDVQPDGYDQVGDHGEHARKKVLRNVPPSRLIDKGSNVWIPAKVLGISTQKSLSEPIFTDCTSESDPFEQAIGFVRLDGSAGDASRRGDILDTFKRDPMTSICLLTKTSAGVGLNLSDANYAIVLEPSIDSHDELQSIARIHRIGQSRPVKVLKFFLKGTVEERILKRRQKRGELCVSINAVVGSTGADEDKGGKESEVSSSRAMTYEDLEILLGVDT